MTEKIMTGETPALTYDQRARAAALKEAKEILKSVAGPFQSRNGDVTDLHSLASYILTGEDPWSKPYPQAGVFEIPQVLIKDCCGLYPLCEHTGSEEHVDAESIRTPPDVAVNAVLDALQIEVERLSGSAYVSMLHVRRAIEDARPTSV
jgi:hypothetical protein